jgi:hypothetical protein
MSKPSASGTVTIEWHGETLRGDYVVADKLLKLVSNIGKKATQLNDTPPDLLAKTMLRELAQEHAAKVARGP